MNQRRTCLIYNPTAGRGRPPLERKRWWTRVDTVWDIRATRFSTHAKQLVHEAIADGFTHIVAAGGDGTIHEVANGLLESASTNTILTVLPWGSANDYAHTLGMTRWWRERRDWVDLKPITVDAARISTDQHTRYFVNGCGLGFNGRVTIESRKIRTLSGMPLYAVAMVRAMVKHFRTPTVTLTCDDLTETTHTLALTIGNAQREGGFPLTDEAILDDGLLDWLRIGPVSRWELIRYLPNMIRGDLPMDHPHVRRGRGRVLHIESNEPLCVHADGELVCVPNEPRYRVSIELLPRRLVVNTFARGMYGRTD
jgi:diacylglycerol kinase (ATP)